MGLIVAANPLGQMIFSPLFGLWSNKSGSIRIPLLCSLALFTFASILYSSLEFVTSYVKYWMLISRFLIGVSSGKFFVIALPKTSKQLNFQQILRSADLIYQKQQGWMKGLAQYQ